MSTLAARVVFDAAELDLGRKLGEGGQGTVHEVRHTGIGTVGNRASVVCKEYREELLGQLNGEALHAMVARVNELTITEARWLSARAAWPSAVVTRDGRPVGFLMRSAPSEFTFEFKRLSARAGTATRLATFDYLLNDDAYTTRIGLRLTEQQRVQRLAAVAELLSGLHRLGIAVGDLSPKNLLFGRPPEPGCFLIDCDTLRLHGATVLPQVETPDWALPGGEEKGTAAGDVYKLGLLVLRVLARSQTAADPGELRGADKALVRLVRGSLQADPARRPSAGEWEERLRRLAGRALRAPAPQPSPVRSTATSARPRLRPWRLLWWRRSWRYRPWRHRWRRSSLRRRTVRMTRSTFRGLGKGVLAVLMLPVLILVGIGGVLAAPFRGEGVNSWSGFLLGSIYLVGGVALLIGLAGWLESH
jgi:serine/threonine protein kinase